MKMINPLSRFLSRFFSSRVIIPVQISGILDAVLWVIVNAAWYYFLFCYALWMLKFVWIGTYTLLTQHRLVFPDWVWIGKDFIIERILS